MSETTSEKSSEENIAHQAQGCDLVLLRKGIHVSLDVHARLELVSLYVYKCVICVGNLCTQLDEAQRGPLAVPDR